MSVFNVKVGETGARLTVRFNDREEGIADASIVQLVYLTGGIKYTRTMTIIDDVSAYYIFTSTDFTVLTTAQDAPCEFKITTTGGSILYWPKPGRDVIRVELPL